MINRALAGSNVSNFSTGNQSHPLNDPVNFDPHAGRNGETFVIEQPDTDWAANMRQQLAYWNQYGQPVGPAANAMGNYGTGGGAAAVPGAGTDSD